MATSVPCAIELEPKTLNPGQINHARELAVVSVLQKIELEGDLVQGLEKVHSIKKLEQITERNDPIFPPIKTSDENKNGIERIIGKGSHNCLCKIPLIDSPDEMPMAMHKEPLTAPF